MNILQLGAKENEQIEGLLALLTRKYLSPCDEEFIFQARRYAGHLPERILNKLSEFRCLEDHNGIFLLSGFSIDDRQIGPTPAVAGKEIDERSASREGYMLMLLISFLGDAIGWSSQRNGALINNILPMKAHENEQLSTGSVADLDWHTEEAFHPFRADYLALMCLRNPDGVPTILGSIQDVPIDRKTKETLFEPRFVFLTDKNFSDGGSEGMAPTSVLFGDFDTPYIKIDPSFMQTIPGDPQAKEALEKITAAFRSSLYEQVLQQGDILFLDNYRVVHGRKGFRAKFDGTDRWLKRINITTDLRKSRVMRQYPCSRIIMTN